MKKKLFPISLFFIISVVSLFWEAYFVLVLFFIYVGNLLAYRHVISQRFDLFGDRRRNIDFLIIGQVPKDICDTSSTMVVSRNGRSLESSYYILISLFSILREDGEGRVVIYYNKNRLYGFSPVDYAIFHPVTALQTQCAPHGIERKIVLISLLKSIIGININKNLFFKGKGESEMLAIISGFCNNRNINVEYKLVD